MRRSLLVLFAAFASGDPAFHETTLAAGPHAGIMVPADLSHDSRPDLIVADSEDGAVTILLNEGGGRFHAAPGSPFNCGSQPNDFAIADFNRDGHPDLAIVNTQTPFISIILGDGRGSFTQPLDPLFARNPIRTRTESQRLISPAAAPST